MAVPRWYFVFYLLLVLVFFAVVRVLGPRAGRISLVAFAAPLVALCVFKYLAPAGWAFTGAFVGISYLSFRCSLLALEVRNGAVKPPTLWEYLAFALFLPTIQVGPISSYRRFHESVSGPRNRTQLLRSSLRILLGAAKYVILANLLAPLTFQGMMADRHRHHVIDLVVAPIAYLVFLYVNFSGFCDLAIGAAGLMGVEIQENFSRPFGARNPREFWARWHITLSNFLNQVVFTPLSTALGHRFGKRYGHHGIAIALVVTFLIIGIWHGVGWSFVIFGALHAVAVTLTYYYTLALRRRLGPQRFRAYQQNRVIRTACIAATFLWTAFCMIFFANDLTAIRNMLAKTELSPALRVTPSESLVVWPIPLVPGVASAMTFDTADEIGKRVASSHQAAREPEHLQLALDSKHAHQGAGCLRVSGEAQPPRFANDASLLGVRVLVDNGHTVDLRGRRLAFDVFIPNDSPVEWVIVSLATGEQYGGPNIVERARVVDKGKWTTLHFDPQREPPEFVNGIEINGYVHTPGFVPLYLRHVSEVRVELWTHSAPGTMLTAYIDDLKWE
jgi:D-alanyl-lipoteichoic acid acyltransferase DltB (MBOAT superfamily)